MRRHPIIVAVLLVCALMVAATPAPAVADEVVTVGVLSYRGTDAAERTWGPTIEHLNAALPDVSVRLLALDLAGLTEAAIAGGVDFVVTNPGHSFQLVRRTGASRVASARTLATEDQTRALGSVILTRADGPVRTLAQLEGQTLGVVAEDAFGGNLIARHALQHALGDDAEEVGTTVVGFPHQAVIAAVLEGRIAAGAVRSCLIESMAEQGQLDPTLLRVLGRREAPRFGCVTSTDLYPGWAFLKMPHVSTELATEVTKALLAMPLPRETDRWLGHDGWIAPVSYAAVEAVYRDLGLYPYDEDLESLLRGWVGEYAVPIGIAAVAFGLFLLHVAHVEILVHRRTRQLEQAVQRTRTLEAELAHAERVSSMSMLAGSLAHDLNQPLAAISTYAHGLHLRLERDTADREAIDRTLRRISEEANRASQFIRSMRTFLTKQAEKPETFDLRALIDEVVTLMTTHARKQDCALDWRRPAEPAPVHGDGVQLRQVVVALVQNAVDATTARDDRGPSCSVEITLDRGDRSATIVVADRGTGLSEQARHHAFDPFFSTKGGLGLGLATAAAIVDRHDGTLTLADRPGGGTCARLRLPLAVASRRTSEETLSP